MFDYKSAINMIITTTMNSFLSIVIQREKVKEHNFIWEKQITDNRLSQYICVCVCYSIWLITRVWIA